VTFIRCERQSFGEPEAKEVVTLFSYFTSDVETSYLALEIPDEEPMDQLRGYSITYRIAVGSQQGRKVFTLQTLPGSDESFSTAAGNITGFSLEEK
jgi:hypothetical protein